MLTKFYRLSNGNKIARIFLIAIPLSAVLAAPAEALVGYFVSSGGDFFIGVNLSLVVGFFWSLIFFTTLSLTIAAQRSDKAFEKLALKTVALLALFVLVTNPSSIMVSPILILAGYLVGKLINIVLK